MAKKIPDKKAYIQFGELQIPVSVYFERRRNTRISIGSSSVHLRLSGNLSNSELSDQIIWAKKWLNRRFEKAPALLERFKQVTFHDRDRIKVMGEVYVVHIEDKAMRSLRASMSNRDIFIQVPTEMVAEERNKGILKVIHKLMCQRYQQDIEKRVAFLNQRHFKYSYKDITLKYLHSKWGSCSHDGHLVLSSKLLVCPKWIIDYVIVHELAHLRELNHSSAYWSLVESAIPNYEKADQWLNEDGAAMEIKPLHTQGFDTVPLSDDSISSTPVVEGHDSNDNRVDKTPTKDNVDSNVKEEQSSAPASEVGGSQLSLF